MSTTTTTYSSAPRASSLSLLLQEASACTSSFPLSNHHDVPTSLSPKPLVESCSYTAHRISPIGDGLPASSDDFVATSVDSLRHSYDQVTMRMYHRIRTSRQQQPLGDNPGKSTGATTKGCLHDALRLNSLPETNFSLHSIAETLVSHKHQHELADDQSYAEESEGIFDLEME